MSSRNSALKSKQHPQRAWEFLCI